MYYRPGQTIYVYTKDGAVTSYQNTEGSPVEARKACPTSTEIRNIEFDINRLANRDNPLLQRDLHRQLAEARACR